MATISNIVSPGSYPLIEYPIFVDKSLLIEGSNIEGPFGFFQVKGAFLFGTDLALVMLIFEIRTSTNS